MNNVTFLIFEFIFKIRLKQINRKKLKVIFMLIGFIYF